METPDCLTPYLPYAPRLHTCTLPSRCLGLSAEMVLPCLPAVSGLCTTVGCFETVLVFCRQPSGFTHHTSLLIIWVDDLNRDRQIPCAPASFPFTRILGTSPQEQHNCSEMNDKGFLLKIHPKMDKGKEKSGQGTRGFSSRPCRVGCCPAMEESGPDAEGDAGSGRRQRWAGRGHMTLIILEMRYLAGFSSVHGR